MTAYTPNGGGGGGGGGIVVHLVTHMHRHKQHAGIICNTYTCVQVHTVNRCIYVNTELHTYAYMHAVHVLYINTDTVHRQ